MGGGAGLSVMHIASVVFITAFRIGIEGEGGHQHDNGIIALSHQSLFRCKISHAR
jgi:hypothetical protein